MPGGGVWGHLGGSACLGGGCGAPWGWQKRGWPWGDTTTPPQPWSQARGGRKERPKPREPAARLEKAKQKSAQQELKQRQRAEIYALNRVMTELEQQQFDSFCKQMQASGE
ncbi:unnamed protein product [Bubo scandiacus]